MDRWTDGPTDQPPGDSYIPPKTPFWAYNELIQIQTRQVNHTNYWVEIKNVPK
jgi:hypothetical protein